MSNLFYQKNEKNYFDNLVIDVNQLYLKWPINKKFHPKINQVNYLKSIFYKIYRSVLIPFKIRRFLWNLFRQTNIDLIWFNEFKKYWINIIGGRPLWNIQDLFFLKNRSN